MNEVGHPLGLVHDHLYNSTNPRLAHNAMQSNDVHMGTLSLTAHNDDGIHGLVMIVIDNRDETVVRKFLVTGSYDYSTDPTLVPLIEEKGLWIVFLFRAVNARRQHAVGTGQGLRISVQQRMLFKSACAHSLIHHSLYSNATLTTNSNGCWQRNTCRRLMSSTRV